VATRRRKKRGKQKKTGVPARAKKRREKHRHRAPDVRFEGVVHLGAGSNASFAELARFDVDRIPDPEGAVRILATVDDLVRLVDRGLEVTLKRALPVRPLASELITGDKALRAWLERRLKGIKRKGGS
jgi:hypothetical protein